MSIRCDEAMRKSKERCYTPDHRRWKCTNECSNCICCLYKDRYGLEHHFNPMSKGGLYELKAEGEQGRKDIV